MHGPAGYMMQGGRAVGHDVADRPPGADGLPIEGSGRGPAQDGAGGNALASIMSRRPAAVVGRTSRNVPVAIDRTYTTSNQLASPGHRGHRSTPEVIGMTARSRLPW